MNIHASSNMTVTGHKMIAYEFYLVDGTDEPKLIAILPERRKNPLRITRESVMRWGRLAAGSYVDPEKIYFIQVEFQKELHY
jgi:hypothetical protein